MPFYPAAEKICFPTRYMEDLFFMKKFIPALCLTAAVATAADLYPTEYTQPGQWFLDSIQETIASKEIFYRSRLDKLNPAADRQKLAEDFHRTIEEQFIANREEDAAIEKALKWQKGDFTWHNDRFYKKTGCTSWFIHPELSVTGAAMLQKNRDYTGQNMISARLFRAMPGRYKVLTVGDLWSSGAGAVMNEKGVMITQNDGLCWEGQPRKISVGCVFVLRYLAEHCASADEALATLQKMYARGTLRDGDLYFIADCNKGYVVETTTNHVAYSEITFGFEVRANNYLLPGLRSLGKQKRESFLNGASRRYLASEFLRERSIEQGKISPLDLMDLSRYRDVELEKANWRQVCMKNTIASTMMAPDKQYPQYLSAAFVSIGPPRHTIYLPIPMAATAIPADLTNGDWGLRAFALREKIGLDHNKLADFKKLETALVEEFFAVKEQARKLLRAGKRKEAVALLDKCFIKQYNQAKDFLKEISR